MRDSDISSQILDVPKICSAEKNSLEYFVKYVVFTSVCNFERVKTC